MAKRKASPAQLRALARGRAKLKAMRKRSPTRSTKKVGARKTRRKNPGMPTRGSVSARDIPSLTRGVAKRRATQQSTAKRTLRRLPNPPHYVIRGPRGYFDGAGWVKGKTQAAQYLSQTRAAMIGRKVANATGKPVYVVTV